MAAIAHGKGWVRACTQRWVRTGRSLLGRLPCAVARCLAPFALISGRRSADQGNRRHQEPANQSPELPSPLRTAAHDDNSAISPKKSPSARRTLPLGAFTSTAPLAMRYMASPRSPLRTIVVPAATERALRIPTNSAIERASKRAKKWHLRDHGERHNEVAATDFLVEAAPDDRNG